ncbi:MAG: hypothetical protein ACREVL_20005 [Solimonas sp.]
MKTTFRHLLCFLKWVALLLLVLIAAVIAMNAFDEPLRPEASAMLDAKPDVPDEQNAFYAFIALSLEDSDLYASGHRRLERLRLVDAQRLSYEDGMRALEEPRHAAFATLDLLSNPAGLEQNRALVRSKPADARQLLDSRREALERYRRLKNYPRFADLSPQDPSSPSINDWMAVHTARKLWGLQLATQIEAGEIDLAIADLKSDTLYWRKILAEPDTRLTGKMFIVSLVRSDLSMAGALLRTTPLSPAQMAPLRGIASPISDAERSLAGAFKDELRFGRHFLERLPPFDAGAMLRRPSAETPPSLFDKAKARIEDHFFLFNATINEMYRQNQDLIAWDRLTCIEQTWHDFHVDEPRAWELAYNYTGKIISAVGVEAYGRYSGRMCDLVGFQRMLALQLRIAVEQVPDAGIAGFVTNAGPNDADPNSGEPMRWLTELHALSFDARDAVNRRDWLPWRI